MFLGIDIGSISTNIVLMDENREVVAKYYLMTASRPIEAVRTGFRDILERYGELADVQAVGVTGSGRHLIGDLAGADVVVNEITAMPRLRRSSARRWTPFSRSEGRIPSTCGWRTASSRISP